MKRIIALTALFVAIQTGLFAQADKAPVAQTQGTVLEYKTTGNDGSETLYRQQVAYVKEADGHRLVGIRTIGTAPEGMPQEQFDKLATTEYVITDDSWWIDIVGTMERMMKQSIEMASELDGMGGMKDLKIKVETGDSQNPVFPIRISPGESLGFPPIKIKVKVSILSVSCEIEYRKYECTGKATVTVPAGTFETYIIEEEIFTKNKALGFGDKTTEYARTWYAPGVGEIKSQSLDKDGKIVSETVLNSINTPGA